MAYYRVTLTFSACLTFQHVNFYQQIRKKVVKFNHVLIQDFLEVIHSNEMCIWLCITQSEELVQHAVQLQAWTDDTQMTDDSKWHIKLLIQSTDYIFRSRQAIYL